MDHRYASEAADDAGVARAHRSVAPGKTTRSGAIMRSPRDSASPAATATTAPPATPDVAAGFCYFGGEAATLDESNARAGAPLPATTRGPVEQATGRDLSAARVHRDDDAAAQAAALDARAFTVGSDIYLGAGEEDPWLLAHEATHVAQQQESAAAPQPKGLHVVSEHDPAEQQADQVADAVVAGQVAPLAALAPVAGGTAARKGKTTTTPPTYLSEKASLTTFVAALAANDAAAALTIWRDPACAATRTGITSAQRTQVADVLKPADAVAVFADLGHALDSVAVLTALAATKRTAAWHTYLDDEDQLEALATSPEVQRLAPTVRAGLDAILKLPKSAFGALTLTEPARPPEMRFTKGTPPAIHHFTVTELAGWKLKPKAPYKDRWWNWMLTIDNKRDYLKAAPPHDLAKQQTLIETHQGPTVTYDLTPTKVDAEPTSVNLDLRVEVMTEHGVAGTTSKTYELIIWPEFDGSDPKAFDLAFERDFDEVRNAPPFADYGKGKQSWSSLFTPRQQKLLAEKYLAGGRVVPAELFTGETAHRTTAVQRVLLATTILSHGVVETADGSVVSAEKWWSTNCGTWVNGVYIYAGANYATGSMAGGNYVSPTGEVSVGGGTLTAGKPINEDPLKAGKKVDQGLTGTTTQGNGNFTTAKMFAAGAIESGDWLYIDNGNTQSHSIAFLGWKKAGTTLKDKQGVEHPPEFATGDSDIEQGVDIPIPEDAVQQAYNANKTKDWSGPKINAVGDEGKRPEAMRKVSYRTCYAYSQHHPGEGGSFDEYKLGFPASLFLGVAGVWAISKATRTDAKGERHDTAPADTLAELLLPHKPEDKKKAAPKKASEEPAAAAPKVTDLSKLIGELGLGAAVTANLATVGKGDPVKLFTGLAKAAGGACAKLAAPQLALCTPYLDTTFLTKLATPLADDDALELVRRITILVCFIQRFAGTTARNVHTGGRGNEGGDPSTSGLLTDIDQKFWVPKKDAKAAAAAEKKAAKLDANQDP